jgi:hypothetical protein
MPANIQRESENLYVIRFTGTVKRSEFGTGQETLAREIDAGSQPRVLAILEEFEGWEKGADWNDLDFQLTHGGEIAKIAIVGDPRWEPQALAFAGAGFRRAPVKFFPPKALAEANAWLAA